MVGGVSSAVRVAVQDIVDESRIAVTRTISVAGAFISVVLLMVAAVALWFISRAMLNRLRALRHRQPLSGLRGARVLQQWGGRV